MVHGTSRTDGFVWIQTRRRYLWADHQRAAEPTGSAGVQIGCVRLPDRWRRTRRCYGRGAPHFSVIGICRARRVHIPFSPSPCFCHRIDAFTTFQRSTVPLRLCAQGERIGRRAPCDHLSAADLSAFFYHKVLL